MRQIYNTICSILLVSSFFLPCRLTAQIDFIKSVTDGLFAPVRLAISNENSIYVSDAYLHTILRYDSTGSGSVWLEPGGNPVAIGANTGHTLVVGDRTTGHTTYFSPTGEQTAFFEQAPSPVSIAVTNDGAVYIADDELNRIFVTDLSAHLIRTFGDSLLHRPTGCAYDARQQRLVVADEYEQEAQPIIRILVFEADGTFLFQFSEFGNTEGRLSRVQGLAVDAQSNIFAVDPLQAQVSVFSSDGQFLKRFGGFGTEPGQLNAPMDVALSPDGRIWVSAMNSGTLEVFKIEELNGITDPEQIPLSDALLANYPNPFNNGTRIPFQICKRSAVKISLFNVAGQLIRTVDLGILEPGLYAGQGRAWFWDGTSDSGQSVASGIYFVQLKTNKNRLVRRMLYLK